jgi:hypothetical protein
MLGESSEKWVRDSKNADLSLEKSGGEISASSCKGIEGCETKRGEQATRAVHI